MLVRLAPSNLSIRASRPRGISVSELLTASGTRRPCSANTGRGPMILQPFKYFARKSNTTFMLAASVNCEPPCPHPAIACRSSCPPDERFERVVEELALLRRHVAVGRTVLDQEGGALADT